MKLSPPNTIHPVSLETEHQIIVSWSQELERFTTRIGVRFARREARENAKGYLQGLLGTLTRKNCWQLSEAMGADSPYGFQHLVGRAKWDANLVRDDLRAYVLEHLVDPKGVLILDDTGFIKGGKQAISVGKAGGRPHNHGNQANFPPIDRVPRSLLCHRSTPFLFRFTVDHGYSKQEKHRQVVSTPICLRTHDRA